MSSSYLLGTVPTDNKVEVDVVDFVALALYPLARCSTFEWQKSPTFDKSTELNMFSFGDNVDHDTVDKVERVGDSRQSTFDKSATKSKVDFVERVDFQLCCQCVSAHTDDWI